MFEFHQDKKTYFDYQYRTAKEYILPFVRLHRTLPAGSRVLEIGCGEAGVLKAFLEEECQCMGIELHESRIETAKSFMPEPVASGQLQLIARNIYDIDPAQEIGFKFDLIILKDVIEHIPDQDRFMTILRQFLAPQGVVFFAFPPWYMPFGGHQQICRGKWLSKLPYYHLLPRSIYQQVLRWGGESGQTIQELLEIKDTGISIERFESIARKRSYQVLQRKIFLINPIYQFKFGWAPRTQHAILSRLPYLRDFLSTAVYFLVSEK